MREWDTQPLEAYAAPEANTFVDGPFGSNLKVSDYTEEGVRILQLQNLGDGVFIDNNVKFTSHEKAVALARCIVRPGDLLIAKMAEPLARTCIVPPHISRAIIVADLIKFRPDQDIDADFLCAAINSPEFRREAERLSTGTTRTRISLSTLKKIPLRAPAPGEQARIGEIIRVFDEAFDQTEALITKTQQIKAGLMHDLFTRGVTPDGKLRPPRDEAPQLYTESPLGWIPKGWSAGHLSGKCANGRAHIKTGPFGSSLKLEHWVEDGRPVITIGALGEGEFIHSELLHVSEATAERLRQYQLDVGDVVFSRVADVGRSAVIRGEQRGWIMSSNLMRISLDQAEVDALFLQAQLAYGSKVRQQIRSLVNAGGRDVANSQILNRLSFAWPPIPEQMSIVEHFEALESERRTNIENLGKLRQLKHGLMYDLLAGHVRVPGAKEIEQREVEADVRSHPR